MTSLQENCPNYIENGCKNCPQTKNSVKMWQNVLIRKVFSQEVDEFFL